jgi:hypothetical protein
MFVLLVASTAVADDWPRAHPRSWHNRGFGRVVEVFPANSRCNPTAKPYAYAYELGYPKNWDVDAKLVWKGPLVNREAPYEAIVSMDGYLVTFDDWGNLGYDNAVAIYDPRGKLVKSKKLDDLLPADIRDRDRSVSSRYWRKGARYYFDDKKQVVQIHLANAGVLELALADGKHSYSATPGKPLADSNAATEIWETSLRFSSVSDIVGQPGCAKAKPQPQKKSPY